MEFTIYLLPLFAATIISGTLAFYTWRHRRTPGAVPFTIMMVALFEWGFTYILELAATDLALKTFFRTLTFIGVVTTPTTWFLFAIEYTTSQPWVTRRRLMLLAIMPVATLIMILKCTEISGCSPPLLCSRI